MKTKFEDIKNSIVEAQLASTPINQLVAEMTENMPNLLSANHIIKFLGIEPNEFQKLVNLPNHYLKDSGVSLIATLNSAAGLLGSNIELINKELEGKTNFPKPDFYILGKARWKKETFDKWLEEQCR